MEQMLESILIELLNMSLTASAIILVVLLARVLLKKAPRICVYALWAIVLFRLLCPVSFEAEVSMLGVLQKESASEGRMEYIPQDIGYQEQPKVSMPIEAAEEFVNGSLPAGNPAASVNPLQIWLYLGVRIWILGMLILVIYSMVSFGKLKKQLKTAVWERENIYRMKGNHSPFVYGILRPRIYLPEQLKTEEMEYVLLHERTHIKRGDHIYRMLAYAALCIHWFNPLVWLAFSMSGKDMEVSCDEAVLRKLGSEVKKEYSASLLNLACGERIVKGIPLAFGESDTGSRIKHVLKYRKPAKVLVILAVVITVVLAFSMAANPKKKEEAVVFTGVVTYADMETFRPMVVWIPGIGDVMIPEYETLKPYLDGEKSELQEGDLIRITYEGECEIQETYPADFAETAESIEVLGKGFSVTDMESNDRRFLVGIPKGLVSEAGVADIVHIYHQEEVQKEEILLAEAEVQAVDEELDQAMIELSLEQVEELLKGYGAGLYFEVSVKENSYENAELMAKEMLNAENPEDGIYSVSVRSISRSARCIDRYVVSGTAESSFGEIELYFAENCDFFINEEMTSVHYKEVSFDDFTDCVMWGEDGGSAYCNLTFQNGLITRAEMVNPLEKYGISYEGYFANTWYQDMTQIVLEEEGKDALTTYFTLVDTIETDFEYSPGKEIIEIYTGNIGDGDSGVVLFKNEQGEVLHSEGAHTSRAGWNNIYLGESNGWTYILTVHMEDRDDYGSYGYQVYEIGPLGMTMQRAGTSFTWDQNHVYDDELFKEWVSDLEYYLEHSSLLLSSQEGEIRTEQICELDKYNYETLKRE